MQTEGIETILRSAFSEIEFDEDLLSNREELSDRVFLLLSIEPDDAFELLATLMVGRLRCDYLCADEILRFLGAVDGLWPEGLVYHRPYGIEKLRQRQAAGILSRCNEDQLAAILAWVEAHESDVDVPEEYLEPILPILRKRVGGD